MEEILIGITIPIVLSYLYLIKNQLFNHLILQTVVFVFYLILNDNVYGNDKSFSEIFRGGILIFILNYIIESYNKTSSLVMFLVTISVISIFDNNIQSWKKIILIIACFLFFTELSFIFKEVNILWLCLYYLFVSISIIPNFSYCYLTKFEQILTLYSFGILLKDVIDNYQLLIDNNYNNKSISTSIYVVEVFIVSLLIITSLTTYLSKYFVSYFNTNNNSRMFIKLCFFVIITMTIITFFIIPVTSKILQMNIIIWIISFFNNKPYHMESIISISWIILIIIFIKLANFLLLIVKWKITCCRKIYHFLIIIMFTPILLMNNNNNFLLLSIG